MFTLIGSNVQ